MMETMIIINVLLMAINAYLLAVVYRNEEEIKYSNLLMETMLKGINKLDKKNKDSKKIV